MIEILRPCPFCGNKKIAMVEIKRSWREKLRKRPPHFRIWCPACLAFPWGRDDPRELARLWNSRFDYDTLESKMTTMRLYGPEHEEAELSELNREIERQDAEIERLRVECEKYDSAIASRDAEIERLKARLAKKEKDWEALKNMCAVENIKLDQQGMAIEAELDPHSAQRLQASACNITAKGTLRFVLNKIAEIEGE